MQQELWIETFSFLNFEFVIVECSLVSREWHKSIFEIYIRQFLARLVGIEKVGGSADEILTLVKSIHPQESQKELSEYLNTHIIHDNLEGKHYDWLKFCGFKRHTCPIVTNIDYYLKVVFLFEGKSGKLKVLTMVLGLTLFPLNFGNRIIGIIDNSIQIIVTRAKDTTLIGIIEFDEVDIMFDHLIQESAYPLTPKIIIHTLCNIVLLASYKRGNSIRFDGSLVKYLE